MHPPDASGDHGDPAETDDRSLRRAADQRLIDAAVGGDRGAMDSLPKPIERDETLAFLRRVDSMKTIREPASASTEPASETPSQDFRGMYGATQVMRDTFKMISRVGRTDVTVLGRRA
jgi:DNA-binding NtrC family response regulator